MIDAEGGDEFLFCHDILGRWMVGIGFQIC
jgi:hypothetical protein